jgi:hypothetical protein
MEEIWFRPWVWTDYRLTILFAVVAPLILMIWGFWRKAEAIQRLLIIYWRVASLLMISLYLFIPAWGIGFITDLSARVLIPISLWFWVDLNDEIKDMRSSALKLSITAWRWAMTVYCVLGAIALIPFLSCSFSSENIKTPFCKVWLEVPWAYKAIFHRNSTPGFLGFLGMVGLIVYGIYLVYFLMVSLPRQGRSALEQ